MLSEEERKEKEDFFTELDRLEDLDSNDEEVASMSAPESSPKRPSSKMKGLAAEGMVDLERGESRKRKPSRDVPQSKQRASQPPRLPRASTLPEQESELQPPVKPRLARATTLPEQSPTKTKPTKLKRTFTDLSNLEARLKGTELPKLRPLRKGKNWKPLADIPPGRQIFRGLVFFFVPNNDDDSGARMRIHQAIKYGAKWAHVFSEEVTHILVTRDELDVKMVAKSFADNKIPEEPFLLRYQWLWESWEAGYCKPEADRFRVPGAEIVKHSTRAPAIPPATTTSGHTVGAGDDPNSIQARNDSKENNQSEMTATKPENSAQLGEDALDLAIRDVQTGAAEGMDLGTPEASESEDDSEDRSVGSAEAADVKTVEKGPTKKGGYLCMESHDGKSPVSSKMFRTSKVLNPNADTIEKLQKMANSYQTSDQFRAKAFRQAIGALRHQDQLIRTYQDARKIGIGDHIATQVAEIVSTGRYKRLEYAQNNPRTQIVKLFTGVYGVGEATADRWIAQGFRSLDDLRQKADLTPNQQIGLEHYDDFQQRIPRDEVGQHAALVEKALKDTDTKLQLIIGGSYRRGSKNSGDIDCIIFMEGADIVHLRTLMIDTVIPKLMAEGFLKVALASGHSSSDDSSKWHGASALPESNVWRRIDFLFVPWEELGAALIYFTGNDLFNRSIRFLAGKKGLRLNQHGLYKDVMRGPQRQRITVGTLVESQDEKRIFEILGVPYRPPQERNV
ncbi:hypothetical protein H2200_007929 [Cladophialophora chaetospira]|uniref:DNA polymerase lambda n=1 Tax=Cladophialophora chaetospira TaxID=386627 RepID=A0AA38X6P7_9EURO|nr:hypothetical protein H2200_007929 [Cladophialophora chaetospira]